MLPNDGMNVMKFLYDWMVKVMFEGTTGRVAFDQFGRRREYLMDVLEQRGDREPSKVTAFFPFK